MQLSVKWNCNVIYKVTKGITTKVVKSVNYNNITMLSINCKNLNKSIYNNSNIFLLYIYFKN